MDKPNKKVGIIGCGYIGGFMAKRIQEWSGLKLVALADQREGLAQSLAEALEQKPQVVPIASLIRQVDLVIEAAHKSAVAGILSEALAQGKDLLLMSVGG